MKKLLCLFLAFLTITNISRLVSYADEDSFVNDALAVVREKIDIPENYTSFNSKISVEQNGKYINMTWFGDGDGINDGGQINIRIDEKYRVLSFNQYFYGNFTGNYKLSKISADEAQKTASLFCQKVCPEFYPFVRLKEYENVTNRNYKPYEFTFYRYVGDIPCYDNYIKIFVNPYNFCVSSMSVLWDDFDKIYPSVTELTPEMAKVCMYDKIGMVLEYGQNSEGEIYPRYADLSDKITYVNAYTGELLDTKVQKDDLDSFSKDFYVTRTDEEFDISSLDSLVYDTPYIPFSKDYVLVNASYEFDDNGKYAMLDFETKNGFQKSYVIDVLTKNIRYYREKTSVVNENKMLSAGKCRSIADNFCLKYLPDIYKECGFLKYVNQKNDYGEDVCYFNYSRLINGMVYDNNGIVIGVSPANGNVISVKTGWDIIEIPDFVQSIPKEEAFEKYINAVDFKLMYVKSFGLTREKELRPVYAKNPDITIYVNAITGELIDGNGKNVSDSNIEFDDISDDVAKDKINVLLSCGIFDRNEKFYPDENVRLKDFLMWIARTVDCVIYNDDDIDYVCSIFAEKGIVSYDDILNNGYINMQTGIKYIVSYLGYDEVAVLDNTYRTGFVDEGLIDSDKIGYASIAKGLKIFEGNALLPNEYMKRNVAAQILYNLISN